MDVIKTLAGITFAISSKRMNGSHEGGQSVSQSEFAFTSVIIVINNNEFIHSLLQNAIKVLTTLQPQGGAH